MKKIILCLFLFLFIFKVEASNYTDLYVSKKDVNTQDYMTDCDFLLYDSDDNIVAAWVASDSTYHISNIKKGTYKLIERPLIESSFNDYLSKIYMININSDEAMEITLYNKKIETPRNLGSNNCLLYGFLFICLGFLIIILNYININFKKIIKI